MFPKLKLELVSQYSVELAHELMAGAIDLAIATEPPESASLTRVKVTEAPFYIAMSKHHELATCASITLPMLHKHRWILFERRLHPPVYDKVLRMAESQNAIPKSIGHVTMPEEAFPFVMDGSAVAFVVKAGALLLARNGVTVRPLAHPELNLSTYLVPEPTTKRKLRVNSCEPSCVNCHRSAQMTSS